ncbi:uncharacterized protein LOC141908586 [Tubulanus polymorphus]|uniref:uncharacterized protein LOC141908586 n=1 Tax=Tubulanus polymorphus TaxID=672921 RepID=UPI003DA696BA
MASCQIALICLILGLSSIDALFTCGSQTVVAVPISKSFVLEIGPADYKPNMTCRWIIRPSNPNQLLQYDISLFNVKYSYRCRRDFVLIRKDYEGYVQKMCGDTRRLPFEGNDRSKNGREFTVEFKTHPTKVDTDKNRGVKVVFKAMVERNYQSPYSWPLKPIQVETEYLLEIKKYSSVPTTAQWVFKANNPKNKLKFKVEKLDIRCGEDYIAITNDTDLHWNKRPKYCGNLEKDGALRDALTNKPPSYEWLLERKIESFPVVKFSVQFTVIGSAPTLHSTCQKEPLVIFVDDVYTLRMPRKVIQETTHEYRFTCRWIIRPKNPAKKLNYVIESLDTPYRADLISNDFWFEHVSIYPDYFTKRRPKIAGSLNGVKGYLDGTDADLRSTTPADQWNVNYQYAGYYFNKGVYKELKIKFTSFTG